MKEEQSYYLVNPAGAIHIVSKDHARMRLKEAGFRLAEKEEIAKYIEQKGNQTWDEPICAKFSAEPPDVQELPEPAKVEKPAKAEKPKGE